MEINDLTNGLILRKPPTSSLQSAPKLASTTPEPRPVADTQSRAVDVLRQELRAALDLRFSSKPSRTQPVVPGYTVPATADGIQSETLGRARGLADEQPGRAPSIVVRFRAQVSETASLLRNTLSTRSDVGQIDSIAGLIDAGLRALGSEVENNRVSTAEVLNVERRTRSSSNIQIRTQAGDVVRINVVDAAKFKAEDAFSNNEFGEIRETSVSLKERSGLRITVKGDLNDEELAAIEDVFEQASEIAEDFFDGDIEAALAEAQDFGFDSDQLRNVRLRFREFESQTVTFARERVETGLPATPQPAFSPVNPTDFAPFVNRPVIEVGGDVEPKAVAQPEPVAPKSPEPETEVVPDDDADDPSVAATPGAPEVDAAVDPREKFLSLIGDFLSSVREGFNGSEAGEPRRFFFSETFKLKLLAETVRVQAPVADDAAATLVGDAIDEVAASLDVEPKSAAD